VKESGCHPALIPKGLAGITSRAVAVVERTQNPQLGKPKLIRIRNSPLNPTQVQIPTQKVEFHVRFSQAQTTTDLPVNH
jgi:hypothetical protein